MPAKSQQRVALNAAAHSGHSVCYTGFMPGRDIVINRAPKRLSAARLTDGDQSERDLVENHRPSKHGPHEDVYVAIRDAFNAAGRKLQDHVRRQSGAIKVHEPVVRAEE